jgi:hypothetical protein
MTLLCISFTRNDELKLIYKIISIVYWVIEVSNNIAASLQLENTSIGLQIELKRIHVFMLKKDVYDAFKASRSNQTTVPLNSSSCFIRAHMQSPAMMVSHSTCANLWRC